ncbi:hypothetical protein E4S40_00450 [Algoriphagus kandeliae]|uniref:Uncharacterized protein n=1 Tax=Algoriphagus kandeliae TaxID=2562278 RepID=A0A4Y9QXU5_9BACT|nr:hypothetical protein [Algoriphagus kandeliae]TFV97159.1 hypothetical protein E4S40_00450 [Algoriphagus kandeliae]
MWKILAHSLFIPLILLNGMGYTLIQVHFYADREEITALYCVNKDKPELECNGQCELGKRLKKASEAQENGEEITLEELNLQYLPIPESSLALSKRAVFPIIQNSYPYLTNGRDIMVDFFHPPQQS